MTGMKPSDVQKQDDDAIQQMLEIIPFGDPRRRIYEQLATEEDED